jgi:hypothetical protein
MPGECSRAPPTAGCFPRDHAWRQIGRVNATQSFFLAAPPPLSSTPPYALATPSFRFRALAVLAGRAPLGGAREIVLATYMVARLADDCRPSRELPATIRLERALAARNWLSSVSLPSAVRGPLTRLVDATEGELGGVIVALAAAITATLPYLDDAARFELERFARGMSV